MPEQGWAWRDVIPSSPGLLEPREGQPLKPAAVFASLPSGTHRETDIAIAVAGDRGGGSLSGCFRWLSAVTCGEARRDLVTSEIWRFYDLVCHLVLMIRSP